MFIIVESWCIKMEENKELNEQVIGDIILCEPITRKGKEALDNIGLTPNEITPEFFYDKLRVGSKYDKEKEFIEKKFDQELDSDYLYYQYTVDKIQFDALKERWKQFNIRFKSDSPNEYPLLMLGVAGNGKSIEVNRLIRKYTIGENDFELHRVYFDLEDSFTEITYGEEYETPSNTPLWLFSIKILDGIMKYIRCCRSYCSTILDNFNNIIVKNNLATKEQKLLFQNIGNYFNGGNDEETTIFNSLKSFLSPQEPDKNLRILIKILMWVMFCSSPTKKQYIIIDNVEQYIKLDDAMIQIPNSDISTLYKSINTVVLNMINDFGRIEKDLGWKAFKIVVVLRRTSIGLLDSALLHSPVRAKHNITDVTGYYQIPEIWEKKKEFIWNAKLLDKYQGDQNQNIIEVVDIVMQDNIQAIGMDYQSLIAPLMSYGIRRNARAQAHAAFHTYKILSNQDDITLTLDEFKTLISATGSNNNEIRYMFRRALIEIQFKWAISNGSEARWKNLGLGNLTNAKDVKRFGQKITIQNVKYSDEKNVTLMRRILTYLSYFPDENNLLANGQNKTVVDMFSTVSLYSLVNGVLYNPNGDNNVTDKDFLIFAKVLIALSDMSNEDTKSAPYVILGVNDSNFHAHPSEDVFAYLLKKIWAAGPEKSLPGQIYDCGDFGVRITDAGYSFLLDWQASFSFIASLHCFTIPPLFFLKNIASIKYVIHKVYHESLNLCNLYESEAASFCGNDFTLRTDGYLLKRNDDFVTFRHRVKELHLKHLRLYQKFIEKNYIHLSFSETEMIELCGFINEYIGYYNSWITMEGAPECF